MVLNLSQLRFVQGRRHDNKLFMVRFEYGDSALSFYLTEDNYRLMWGDLVDAVRHKDRMFMLENYDIKDFETRKRSLM